MKQLSIIIIVAIAAFTAGITIAHKTDNTPVKQDYQIYAQVPNYIAAAIGDTLIVADIAHSDNADTLIFTVTN